MQQLFAANFFGHKIHISTHKEADTSDDTIDKRLKKLSQKKKLSEKHLLKLMCLCLKKPALCTNDDIFRILPLNGRLKDGSSFTQILFRQYDSQHQQESGKLFFKLLDQENLDPHLANDPVHDDLALDILLSNHNDLIKKLVSKKTFNPNRRYGYHQSPLAAILIVKHKFEQFRTIAELPNFKQSAPGENEKKPAYLLLEKYDQYRQPELFKLSMDPNSNKWDLRDMGLGKANHFAIIFQEILTNTNDRLIVFANNIHSLLDHYKYESESSRAELINAMRNFFYCDASGSTNCIDQEFTKKAMFLLNSYNSIGYVFNTGPFRNDFWHEIRLEEESKQLLSQDQQQSQKKHKIIASHTCEGCKQLSDDLFRSSNWCAHAYCSACWLKLFSVWTKNELLLCPHPHCKILLPPSLFQALSLAEGTLEKAVLQITYHENQLLHSEGYNAVN